MTNVTVKRTELMAEDVGTVEEFGELAKLAIKLRMEANVEFVAADEHEGTGNRYRIVMSRFGDQQERLNNEVANLFILWCMTSGITGDDGLKTLRYELERRHFPLDRPIEDVMSIGGGPGHEGH